MTEQGVGWRKVCKGKLSALAFRLGRGNDFGPKGGAAIVAALHHTPSLAVLSLRWNLTLHPPCSTLPTLPHLCLIFFKLSSPPFYISPPFNHQHTSLSAAQH